MFVHTIPISNINRDHVYQTEVIDETDAVDVLSILYRYHEFLSSRELTPALLVPCFSISKENNIQPAQQSALMTKSNAPTLRKNPGITPIQDDLRVIYFPSPPCDPFIIDVNTPEEAHRFIGMLRSYDKYLAEAIPPLRESLIISGSLQIFREGRWGPWNYISKDGIYLADLNAYMFHQHDVKKHMQYR